METIGTPAPSFGDTMRALQDTGLVLCPDRVTIRIPNARDNLWRAINELTDRPAVWLPEYEEVARWLACNDGRGLLCFGNCGRGKSLLCCRALPMLIRHFLRKVVTVTDAQTLNARLDEMKRYHLLCVDDIGTESVAVKYGERRLAFAELADEAEKHGKLLLITTNLNREQMTERYGERTLDRLRQITKPVCFKGPSLRG